MKSTTERRNAVFQGIVEAGGQMENAIKHRINVGDKENDANDKTVASNFDNKFCIPLNFEILESGFPLYQYGLGSRLTYELTFAEYSDVIKASDPDASYRISNISLEFDTVTNTSLTCQIRTEYMKSSILFDRILRSRIIPLNNSNTSFSVAINSPSKSLKGVLLIFMKERSAIKFNRDTEEFFNPKITKVEVTVEGSPNKFYVQNMEYRHQYGEIMKHFGEGRLKDAGAIQKDLQLHNINIVSYYTILQNKRMRRCGLAPPPIIFERLKLPQQIIYRRKENLSESPNHQKYWENILVSRFYEQFSRNRRNLGHFRKFEKISNS